MRKETFWLAAVAAVMTSVPAMATGGLVGKPIEVAILYPDASTVFGGPQRFNIVDQEDHSNENTMIYRFDGDRFEFRFGSSVSFSGAFNGFRISDYANALPNFLSVGPLATSVIGFNDNDITVDANNIYVNTTGASFRPGEGGAFTINVSSAAAVPEPASWAMMLVGFGAVGSAIRSRKRHAATLA